MDADIPVIPGSGGPISCLEEVEKFGREYGYPLMIQAALGGGSHGMRIVRSAEELKESYERAKSEAADSKLKKQGEKISQCLGIADTF